jgi:hypothetical protein
MNQHHLITNGVHEFILSYGDFIFPIHWDDCLPMEEEEIFVRIFCLKKKGKKKKLPIEEDRA